MKLQTKVEEKEGLSQASAGVAAIPRKLDSQLTTKPSGEALTSGQAPPTER